MKHLIGLEGLDLKTIFHEVQAKTDNSKMTAFSKNYGQFGCQVMSMELCQAKPPFQIFLKRIFNDLIGMLAVVYIDDSLIVLMDEKSHLDRMEFFSQG